MNGSNTITLINQLNLSPFLKLILFFIPLIVIADQSTSDLEDNRRVINARKHCGENIKNWFLEKGMEYPPPSIFIRIFKFEQEVELWSYMDSIEKYELIHTWPFTAFSGTLGPKRRRGDLQIPEGVYFIDRFNPWSSFHLSLGLNYPNKSDKLFAHGNNPGGDIFIHGSEVTIGCVPIGDKGIEELFVITLDNQKTGNKKIPVHIFPCRMNTQHNQDFLEVFAAENERLTRFWHNLKTVYDAFETTKIFPPIWINDEGKYIVD